VFGAQAVPINQLFFLAASLICLTTSKLIDSDVDGCEEAG